jgi:hypothetical protein
MKHTLHPILAVILGIVLGSLVNSSLVHLGEMLIPMPAGADTTSTEGLVAAMKLFGPQHFVFPFLAHAVGTFVAAFLAYRLGRNVSAYAAYIIGGLFFAGGSMMVFIVPSPMWFNVLDLVVAYFPMALLGKRLA